MTTATARPLQTTRLQRALSLGLAAVITAVLLTGLLGQAGSDRAALLAQQQAAVPHAIAGARLAPMA